MLPDYLVPQVEKTARIWFFRHNFPRWTVSDAISELMIIANEHWRRYDSERGGPEAFISRYLPARLTEEYVRQYGRWVRDECGRRVAKFHDHISFDSRVHSQVEAKPERTQDDLAELVDGFLKANPHLEWARYWLPLAPSSRYLSLATDRPLRTCEKVRHDFIAFAKWYAGV